MERYQAQHWPSAKRSDPSGAVGEVFTEEAALFATPLLWELTENSDAFDTGNTGLAGVSIGVFNEGKTSGYIESTSGVDVWIEPCPTTDRSSLLLDCFLLAGTTGGVADAGEPEATLAPIPNSDGFSETINIKHEPILVQGIAVENLYKNNSLNLTPNLVSQMHISSNN